METSDRSNAKYTNKSRGKCNKNSLGMLISYKYQAESANIGKCVPSKDEDVSATKQKRGNITSGLILGRKLRSNKNKLAPQQQQQPQSPSHSSSQANATLMTSSVYYNQRNLQLIASKCRCEFYMIDFDDKLPNSEENDKDMNDMSTLNQSLLNQQFEADDRKDAASSHLIDLNGSFNEPVDCFTLIHHDLNLCTNSKQYKLIMDLVNNLVLYFRPRRKQVIEKQKSIKFNLQLSMGMFLRINSFIYGF